mgnify:CR=1 FL=1
MAGLSMDSPASPLKITLQSTFKTAAPITVPNSHFQLLFHAAVMSNTKKRGTNKLINILGAVQAPFKYSIS